MKETNVIKNKVCGSEDSNEPKPKTRTVIIPLEKLAVCPHNPRKRDLDLDELVASVKEDEVKEVIEVHPYGDVWHVIAGQRRFLAAKKAGKSEVECLEYTFDETAAEEWCMQDAFHKKEYHPLDIADLSKKAVEKYGSISKASKATGISESKLKKYHGMKGLVKELREKIGSQGTNVPSVETLRKISSLPETKQVEAFEAINGKPRSQAEKILDRIEAKSEELAAEDNDEKAIILIEVSKDVQKNLTVEAKNAQMSLETFCAQVLEQRVSSTIKDGGN
jgi:ParB/RepB/Spo0J family partition protein